MKKYIITAKNPTDIINLSLNTKGVDLSKVKWDWANIVQGNDDAMCESEQEIEDALAHNELDHVDDMIMSGDVPVGGMVVVCDGKSPKNGFICANGKDWIIRKLKVREANATVYSIFKKCSN